VLPTAQALAADVAATPERPLPAGPGLASRFHVAPFHRRISGSETPLPEQPEQPTAQALLADVAVTWESLLPAGLGLATRFHAVPSQ
jgi:hypothetical protein